MASTIKVDNVQNQPGTNVINKCGTTVTLGASGDTVSLASGASQSGFGRSGSVNWDTTKKTTGFTAVSGNGYFCDTSGGGFTLTLPSSPSAGDIVGLRDYASTFNTQNLTVGRGGSNLNGSAGDKILNTANLSLTLVYVDATEGWIPVEEGTGFVGEAFITATGGTITTSGNDKIHTFTGPGNFVVCSIATCSAQNLVSYVVVAGGGGGGNSEGAGGGGAGGYREVVSPGSPYTGSPLNGYPTPGNRITVTNSTYPITVGAGGTVGPCCPGIGSAGGVSTFSTITSAGGGGGGSHNRTGTNGGSGGGGGGRCNTAGGTGNTPPVTPAQGTNGGASKNSPSNPDGGGGGGGATVAGGQGYGPTNPDGGAPGGNGATSSINATPTARGGGGGGGKDSDSPDGGDAGDGGTGGGGDGGSSDGSPRVATAGTVNTGGGGGGGARTCKPGQAGGSGIVIIRYKYQ